MLYGITLLAASLYAAPPAVAPPVIGPDSLSFRIVAPAPMIPLPARPAPAPPDATATAASTAPSTAREEHAASWSSKFSYASHGIFVRVALDGADAGWFLIDTGANATVIDTDVAHARHLASAGDEVIEGTAGKTRATVYRLGNVSVSGATAIAVTGVAQDLSGFPAPNGEHLAGILGSDFLGAFVMRIDFASRQVTFSASASDSITSGRTAIHFDTDHGAPRIPVTLDGHVAADFRIDTGLHGAYDDAPYVAVTGDVWRDLSRDHGTVMTKRQVNARGLGDADITLPVARIGRLAIGSASVESPWVVPQEKRGYFARDDAVSLLGNGVLEHFSPVTIDYLTGTLYLTVPR